MKLDRDNLGHSYRNYVLYEMLTGKQAFEGDDASDLLGDRIVAVNCARIRS